MYGKGGGGVVCFRHNIVSAVSHTYKQHLFYMIVFSASSRLRLCRGQRALTRERSLRGAPSLNPSLAPADVADHPLHRPASP